MPSAIVCYSMLMLVVSSGGGRPLDDVPDVLCSVAELATSNTSRKRVVGDTDRVVLVLIGKGIITLGHSTNKDADALLRSEIADVVTNSHDLCVERESDLAAVWWQVIGDWILNDLEQFLLRGSTSNRELVQKLDHKTRETLEGTRNSDSR